MKTHTNTFKTNLIMFGKQIDAKITYTLNNEQIVLTNEELNSIQPITQGDLLKSIMKELYIDSNVEIPINTEIQFEFGLFNYNNDEYEYVNFGKYYVTKSEYQEDTRSYLITCYDKMINSMVDYEEVAMIYPTTVRSYINELCETIGLDFANASDTFANYDKEVPTDLYKDLGYTYRGVLDELAQVTASNICINANNELEIRYITDTNETFDEEYFSEDNVKFGKKIGKINSIVLSRSAESDNVYLRDEQSVAQNGLYEIKIIDNQIMNFNNRSEFLPDILQRLDNLEFYSMDVKSTGICYLDICDRYTIAINNNSYTCVLMNDEININQGLEENIYVEEPKVSETEYKYADETDRKINQTYIIVNKQQGQINAVVSQVDEIEQELSSPTSIKEGKYFDLEDALDSPLIDFSLYGETQQDSTTGKNLYGGFTFTKTSKGVRYTYYKDGSIKADGTAEASGNAYSMTSSEARDNGFLITLEAGTYTLSGGNSQVRIELVNSTGGNISYVLIGETSRTFTISSSTQAFIRLLTPTSTTVNNITVYPMLEKSNSATSYEPYTNGASPNPDYPQEIHNVSGDNTIEICGKNLYNGTDPLTERYTYIMPSKIGETYTLSFEGSTTATGGGARAFLNNHIDKERTTSATDSAVATLTSTSSSYNLTLTSTINGYLFLSLANPISVFTIQDIMLEKSSTATTYEAYTGQSQLISLGVDNLLDVSTITTQEVSGITITNNGDGSITLNGTCTANFVVRTNQFQLAQGTYTLTPNNNFTSSDDGNYISLRLQNTTTNLTGSTTRFYTLSSYNTFTNDTTQNVRFTIRITSGTELNNVTIKPQLEKGSKKNSYSPYGTTPIELNKIDTYQDYIYKDNDRWYLHKEIGKVVLNGSEDWQLGTHSTNTTRWFYYVDFSAVNDIGLCNYFTLDLYANRSQDNIHFYIGSGTLQIRSTISDIDDFKTWLSNNKPIVDYVLATPTNTEITDTTLLEQLNNLMTLPLYKNMTHITLTPNDLQPTMKIEYYRDTSINQNFVPKEDMTKYYTKTETNAQIQISNSSIKSEVARVESKTDENNGLISGLDEKITTNQSSNVFEINALKKTVYQDGVEMLENSLVKIDINGINTSKQGETFNTQITNKTFEVRDGTRELALIGYDSQENRTVARMDDIESKRATIGVHRCETITRSNKKRTAWFYVGGGN